MTEPISTITAPLKDELYKAILGIRQSKQPTPPHNDEPYWTLEELLTVATRKRGTPQLRASALTAIRCLPNINDLHGPRYDICKKWVQTRDPGLAEIIKEKQWVVITQAKTRLLLILLTGQTATYLAHPNRDEIIMLLQIIAEPKKQGDLSQIAEDYLRQVNNAGTLELMAEMWQVSRHPLLLEILDARNYYPVDSPRLQLWLTFFLPKWETELLGNDARIVEKLLKFCNHAEPFVAQRARELLPRLQNKLAQDEVCWQVVLSDIPFVQSVALEQGWLPEDFTRRLLFYFVTEQWDKYDELDFDGRHLRLYYQTSNPDFRRRLAAKVRASGRTEYLQILTGGEARTRAAELDGEEADILVKILGDNAQWRELWEFVPLLPLYQSAQAVKKLVAVGWQPIGTENQNLLNDLHVWAASGVLSAEEALRRLPAITHRSQSRIVVSTRRTKPEKIYDMAFSPVAPLLGLAVSGGRIVVWNVQTAKVEQLIINPSKRSVGTIAFTKNGTLCWGERSNSTAEECGVYCWQEGEIHKLDEMMGAVTALAAVGESGLLVAGREGWVRSWDTVTKKCIAAAGTRNYYHWARALCVSPDGSKLGVFHSSISLYSLPDLKVLYEVHYAGHVGQAACFSPDGKTIFTTSQTAYLNQLSLLQENNVYHYTRNNIIGIGEQGNRYVPGVAFLPDSNLVVVGRDEGFLDFMDWETKKLVGRHYVFSDQYLDTSTNQAADYLRSIRLSSDGAFLATADLNGCVTLFDLRPMMLWQIFQRPLAQLGVEHLAAIKRYREQLAVAPHLKLDNSLAFAESALLGLRLRYAIELDDEEITTLKAGEFDIEVAE
jgi:WD40 repeat protein